MGEGDKGKLYLRVWRPPQDADKIDFFRKSVVDLILASSYRPNIFHSPLDSFEIKTIGYFLLLIASQGVSEPELHNKVRKVAGDCSFTEITADEEAKNALRESVDRGLHGYIM